MVATCLSAFLPVVSLGPLGSDYGYSALVFLCASNRITNPMLSSDVFQMETVGTQLLCTERVRRLRHYSGMHAQLCVCWGVDGPS